jgi:hypothetical protein
MTTSTFTTGTSGLCQDSSCGAIAPPLEERLQAGWVIHVNQQGEACGWTCPAHSRKRRRRAETRGKMRSHHA